MPARPSRSRGPAVALGVLAALGAGLAHAPVATARTHTVVAGDTLYDLAAANRTTVTALAQTNALVDPRHLTPGQQLTIPDPAPAAPPAPVSAPVPALALPPTGAPAPASSRRTIVPGDTLYDLAAVAGTTVAALERANPSLDPRALIPGRVLTIPGRPAMPAAPTVPAVPAPVASTFAGRTYPPAVTAAATADRDALLRRPCPSRAAMRQIISDAARQAGLDTSLALAVAQQESGSSMRAVSPADAVGAMQVIPSTGRAASALVGRPLDLLDPHDNAAAGVALLRQLTLTAPDEDTAIAGYYQGLSGVLASGMLPDTVAYVASVQAQRDAFR